MLPLKNKKLLVLGGIALSCEIVKYAKQLGAIVYVTDYLEDSPAKSIADKSFMVSTTDVDALVDLVYKENIDGLLTGFIDLLLPYYQKVCEITNKPCYSTEEQFKLLTDKNSFKKLCRKFDIPVVEEYFIKGVKDTQAIETLSYPVLMKPADNSGGKGITICYKQSDFDEKYNKTLSFSPSKQVLVERYMQAEEVTIFYLVQDGEISLTAMGDRYVKHYENELIPLPVGYIFPSKYLPQYENTLDEKVKNLCNYIGLKNGMLFIQSFVEEGNCIFYEIGFRLTGSLEYKLINHSCGYDVLKSMIHFSITGKMSDMSLGLVANPFFRKKYCNITLLAKPGKIGTIKGIDEAKNIENVIDIVLSYKEGDEIPHKLKGTLGQVIIRAFAFADDTEHLTKIMRQVVDAIEVQSEDGGDMLLPWLNTEDIK